MKKQLFCTVAVLVASVAQAVAQAAFVPQVDRGAGAFVNQSSTPAGVEIPQLPASARPLPPAQPVTRIVQEPVAEDFLEVKEVGAPQAWAEVTDPQPLAQWTDEDEARPSVRTGVTVILTPQAGNTLPSVGDGAVALTET